MVRCTWDEKKERINFEKHRIRFEEAQVVWADPFALEFSDGVDLNAEERFIRIGLNPHRGILLVIFCERDEGAII